MFDHLPGFRMFISNFNAYGQQALGTLPKPPDSVIGDDQVIFQKSGKNNQPSLCKIGPSLLPGTKFSNQALHKACL